MENSYDVLQVSDQAESGVCDEVLQLLELLWKTDFPSMAQVFG